MKTRTLPRLASRQRGVVLLFSLIALVVLLIAAVALMRSFNSSLFLSGNIAFKRDLQNQGERAIDTALTQFRAGGSLDNTGARAANVQAQNYSAVMLPTNAQGIPAALQSDGGANGFLAVGDVGKDIAVPDQQVQVRYVVDRMCSQPGDEATLGPGVCVLSNNPPPAGGSASDLQNAARSLNGQKGAASLGVVYRLSVRVRGPRDTQAFFQSTFTVP